MKQTPPSSSTEKTGKTGKGGNESFDEKTKKTSPWKDVWALCVWIVQIVVVVILIWYIQIEVSRQKSSDQTLKDPQTNEVYKIVYIGTSVTCVIFTIMWYILMRVTPKKTIWIANIVYFIIMTIFCIFMFLAGETMLGLVMLLFLILMAVFFWWNRKKIPFTAALMFKTAKLMQKYPATLVTAFIGLAATMLWCGFLTLAFISSYRISSLLIAVVLIFCYFWTVYVIKFAVHTTVAGTAASWYFSPPLLQRSPEEGGPSRSVAQSSTGASGNDDSDDQPAMILTPKNPTLSSAKRTLSYSAGSVCFAALVVAPIETVRYLMHAARIVRDNPISKQLLHGFFFLVADLVVRVVSRLVELFNIYALCEVATYGKDFKAAAKHVWHMIDKKGLMGLVSQGLIRRTSFVWALVTGIFCAIVCGYWAYKSMGGDRVWIFVAMLAFFLGLTAMMTCAAPVESVAATLLICYVEDPEMLEMVDKELYDMFQETTGKLKKEEAEKNDGGSKGKSEKKSGKEGADSHGKTTL